MSKVGKGLLITSHSSRRFSASPNLRVAVSPGPRVVSLCTSCFLKSEIRNSQTEIYVLPPACWSTKEPLTKAFYIYGKMR